MSSTATEKCLATGSLSNQIHNPTHSPHRPRHRTLTYYPKRESARTAPDRRAAWSRFESDLGLLLTCFAFARLFSSLAAACRLPEPGSTVAALAQRWP